MCESAHRRINHLAIPKVAIRGRRGTFTERGYRSPVSGPANLLGWERHQARRRVVVAEQVSSRIGLDSTVLPARCAATGAMFTDGGSGYATSR